MLSFIRHVLAVAVAVVAAVSQASGQDFDVQAGKVAPPRLVQRVTDQTNTLSAGQLDELERRLARFEDTTSTQIVVLMLPTVGDESIEDFAMRVAELNMPGQKERDNGIVLLVAKDDRRLRIEVGYGLEGALPDGLAGTIIRREITPHFRSGDYFRGIAAGVDAIILATRNEYRTDGKQSSEEPTLPFIFVLFVFFLIFLVMRRAGRRSALLDLAALAMLSRGSRRGGPFSSGGWGGGGRGFGGFSGGGGSFGGGGASGSW